MAKEWYLLNSPYSQLSGYESEALTDFGEEGFLEALESEVAVTVEICNYDLSQCVETKVIINNRQQDTKLKTMQRMMMCPIGTCKAGMYVKYKERYWLIVGIVDDNGIYEKAILLICNYKLTWINDKGQIVQRWINAESASQYNNGETNMRFYYIRTDQLMIYMPDDEEGLSLNTGKRFIIDKRCMVYERHFDEGIEKDTSNPVIVYDITRNDSVLDNYVDSGIIGFIVSQCEQHTNDGYYVVDGVGYWLCDVPSPEQEGKLLACDIDCDSDEIYIDLEPGLFTAKFYDESGNEIVEDIPPFTFSLSDDFDVFVDTELVNQTILISTDNYRLNGKTFDLILSADGYEEARKTIKIKEFL